MPKQKLSIIEQQFSGIQEALTKGLQFKAFASGECGEGLRVVRIGLANALESEENERGYGEHPHLRTACMLASQDYIIRLHRKNNAHEHHYYLGSSHFEDPLDKWILGNNRLVAQMSDKGTIRLEARYNHNKISTFVESSTFGQAYQDLSSKLKNTSFLTTNLLRFLLREKHPEYD